MHKVPRAHLAASAPRTYRAAIAFGDAATEYAASLGLPAALVELVRYRVSQLNGCAYCLRLHARAALAAGEAPDRLALLAAWQETTDYFTEQETAALLLAEAITRISEGHVSDDIYVRARSILSSDEIAAVSWLAIAMNMLNRVAISSGYSVTPDDPT